MTTLNIGRLLLVSLALVGLAVAAPVVSAHGTDTTGGAADATPANGTATEWAAWMEAQMTDHMGPGAVDWMESRMGVTIEEMGRYMANGDHDTRGMNGQGGMYGSSGMYGQARGC